MADRLRDRLAGRPVIALALLAGLAAVAIAMAAALAPGLLVTIARPAPIVRAVLAGGSIVLGGRLLLSAIRRIDRSVRRDASDATTTRLSDADLGMLVRGVRLVFLAAAAFAAASGWVLGEPLSLIVALVIAGVDVVETSFMLLVASRRDAG
ncbi:MAG TPA: hypothetical protein VE011_07650 [Candidatus Dormibacteraeota bacterium]|nr:hypothetical protein [Candidatus Dormibacteraeota bacterium]